MVRGGLFSASRAGWLAALAIAVVAPLVVRSPAYQNLLVVTGVNVMLVASLDLLIGQSGLLSLGHAAFWGIGAYTSALLSLRAGVPFVVAMLGAIVAAALCGVVIGYPSLRLRGHYFVLVTFIFGIIVTLLLTSLVTVTRGPMGLPGIPFATVPRLWGPPLVLNTFQDKAGYYYLVLGGVVLTLWLRGRVVKSRMGRALVAIREDEDLGRTVGIGTHGYKVGVFALSTGIAGLAGSLYAHYTTFLAPEIFDFVASFDLFVMNLVGGAGTAAGPVVGPVLLTVIRDLLRAVHPVLAGILFGMFLIAAIAFLPEGLVGRWQKVLASWRRGAKDPRGSFVRTGRESVAWDAHGGEVFGATREVGKRPAAGQGVKGSAFADGQTALLEWRETPVLAVEGLTRNFGGFRAVSNLSFEVFAGEIVGLVGPNGAGKTTTFNLITGFLRPTAGRVWFKGQDVTGMPPHELARRGLVRTFQQTRVFGRLTVMDNLRLGVHRHEPGGLRRGLLGLNVEEEAALERRVQEVLEFTGLWHQRDRRAEELPYGEQRMLGIAVALAVEPEVLLLDEPLAGMNPAEADATMALVCRVRERGVTVVLIDHHMETLMRYCDRLIVLHHGEKLAEGCPADVRANPEVVRVYLGDEAVLAR